MRPSPIVMGDPLTKDGPQLALVQRNHEVQTLAPYGAHQPFAEGVGRRRTHRRFDRGQSHRGHGSIDPFGVNRVSIVDHESVRLVPGNDHPKLLRGPLGRGMRRQIPVQNPSGADLQDDEDVHDPKHCRHDDEEIAGEDRLRVISDERAPRMRSGTSARRLGRHVIV